MNSIEHMASTHGLVFRGGFSVTPDDSVPAQANGAPSKSLLLFGQASQSLWPVFSQSTELSDQLPHPLDRWSERVGNILAAQSDALLLLPFGGPPHHPFFQWAKRAEDVHQSRLGMLIHPQHGLWHAYRFAIALSYTIDDLPVVEYTESACDRCSARPCLSACPVDAFDGNQYDVHACYQFLQKNPDASCHHDGCMARNACPKGSASRYELEHRKFHMTQFYTSLHNRFKADSQA